MKSASQTSEETKLGSGSQLLTLSPSIAVKFAKLRKESREELANLLTDESLTDWYRMRVLVGWIIQTESKLEEERGILLTEIKQRHLDSSGEPDPVVELHCDGQFIPNYFHFDDDRTYRLEKAVFKLGDR